MGVFVEDLGRPGLAGLWAESAAEADAERRSRLLVESPGPRSPVPVAASAGPRSTVARDELAAFKSSLDADRPAAIAS